MERFETIKISIAEAKNVKIFFPDNPGADYLSAVLALFFTLKKMGKNVFLPITNLPEDILSLLGKEKKRISISFNKEISEISYDKNIEGLKLDITPKSEEFDIDDISVEINNEMTGFSVDTLDSFDLVISIGLQRFEELDKMLQASEEELFECTIINIDKKENNENYGDINIIEEKSSIPKVISVLIKQLGEEYLTKEAMSLLLYGFLSRGKIPQDNVPIIKWLLKNGGDFHIYHSMEKIEAPDWIEDFRRSLRVSTLSKDKDIILTHVDHPEREKSEKYIALEMARVFQEWIDTKSFVIAFKDNMDTEAIFYSTDPKIVARIREGYDGTYKENGGIIVLKGRTPQSLIEELKLQ
jgi:nanoRNase/pAp phosphatase (c-di-AMP/oligoRNAs hydrolase)